MWFEIIIIFKHETVNLQKIRTLSKIHSYSKMIIYVCVCVCVWYIWTNVSIYHNKLQKQNSQIHSYEKKNLGKKASFLFYNNPIGSLYHVCTHWSTFLICNSVSQTLQCKKRTKNASFNGNLCMKLCTYKETTIMNNLLHQKFQCH